MSEQNKNEGLSFFGLLTILFIGLKLANIIEWSWVWVLGPIWIPFCIIIFALTILLIFALIKDKYDK
jgi:hypothetical protein